MSQISCIEPNWNREKIEKWWSPSKQLLKSIRQYQQYQNKSNLIAKIFEKKSVLEHHFWSIVTGADIPLNCQLGGGLILPHPNGVVIHPNAQIGVNCIIFQQVTIIGKVKIGDHVDIGAGAKILANVTIGNYAKVGANAVVKNMDLPEKSIAVGIPAKIILPKEI